MPLRNPLERLASLRSNSPLPGSVEENRAKLTLALVMLSGVLLGGTLGFAEIEGWSLWDAFYFTLITITTVGYGDNGLSDAGRKFASILLIGGVASASYTFAMVLQSSLSNHLAWRKRMQKRIDRLRGHTIVCGFGRMGRAVCKPLADLGVPFVVLDRDDASFHKAVEQGFLAVQGEGTEDEALAAAGLEHAANLVAAVDSVAENLVITLIAKESRPEILVIARAEADTDLRKLWRAGADRIIHPFKSGAGEVANLITKPKVADFLASAALHDGDVVLAQVTVHEGSPLVGCSLGDYGKRQADRVSFVALERPGEPVRVPPGGAEVLTAGDHLIVAGDPQQIERMTSSALKQRAA